MDPASLKKLVEEQVKKAIAPLLVENAELRVRMRKLEQRMNSYDVMLKVRQLATSEKNGKLVRGSSAVRDKMKTLDELHDFAHGRHVSDDRAKNLKAKVGVARAIRSAPKKNGRARSNSFGSALGSEIVRNANMVFAAAGRSASGSRDLTRRGSGSASDGRSAKKRKA
jgi:hypothetical protein